MKLLNTKEILSDFRLDTANIDTLYQRNIKYNILKQLSIPCIFPLQIYRDID